MKNTPIRVMCVEDNDLVADAIGRKLGRDPDFVWLGCAKTFDRLMEMVAANDPHVVCLDLDVPGQDTFAMIRTLQGTHPDVRVMVLTGHVREDLVNQAVDAGAWGYLSKAEDSRVIVESFRRVAAGEFILGKIARSECSAPPTPPAVTAQSPSQPSPAPTTSWNPLRVVLRHLKTPSSSNVPPTRRSVKS